jgi:hypothetical protein
MNTSGANCVQNDDRSAIDNAARSALRAGRADNVATVIEIQRKRHLAQGGPTSNIPLEQQLLGAIFVDNANLDRLGALRPEDFAEPLHADVVRTSHKLRQAGYTVTAVTLRTYYDDWEPLADGTKIPLYLALSLPPVALSPEMFADFAQQLHNLSTMRHLEAAFADAATRARNPDPGISPRNLIDDLAGTLERIRHLDDPNARSGALQRVADAVVCTTSPYLIKGLFSLGDIVALFGPTGVGKTFLASDIAWHIAQGKAFRGRRTLRRPVLVYPLEGRASYPKRIVAMRNEHGDPGDWFAWVDAPISLARDSSGSSVAQIIDHAKALAQLCGEPVGLIVIDTLARAMGGDSENDADSIAAVMACVDHIQRETGACVLLVCHPGKDPSKGVRGSSALPAALDVVIRVEREGKADRRDVVLEKARDGEEGPIGAFTLKHVDLGADGDGDQVTSCVVRPVIAEDTPTRRRPRPNSRADLALRELHEIIISGGGTCGATERAPAAAVCVRKDDWRKACDRKNLTASDEPDAKRQAFNRAYHELVELDLIGFHDGFVWLINAGSGVTPPYGLKTHNNPTSCGDPNDRDNSVTEA